MDLVLAVDAELGRVQSDLTFEAHKLATQRYLAAVDRQRAKLGPLFDAKHYLTPNEVERRFAIDWSYVSFAAPDRLETVDHALAMRANAKHEARLSDAFDEVVGTLRAGAVEVFAELDDRLAPGKDGKRKAIRDTALRDLIEFADLLPKRNIGGDDRLAAVVARVAARAEGLSLETLKDDRAAREAFRAVVQEAKAEVGALVTTSRRAISFGRV